jgi:hypothetical protein
VSVTFKIAVTFAILALLGTLGGLFCQAIAQTIGSRYTSTAPSRVFMCGNDEPKVAGIPGRAAELAKRD